ncbi:hypothetical protein [Sutcliffiella horikoshii]|uniref:hypothetical protein n=1 Tax=Sutcliffiella horikoshii TaxID=79883 RepID=UPI001CFF4A9D|nr:hypothetical protein [Sutcliffiella horikoshii]
MHYPWAMETLLSIILFFTAIISVLVAMTEGFTLINFSIIVLAIYYVFIRVSLQKKKVKEAVTEHTKEKIYVVQDAYTTKSGSSKVFVAITERHLCIYKKGELQAIQLLDINGLESGFENNGVITTTFHKFGDHLTSTSVEEGYPHFTFISNNKEYVLYCNIASRRSIFKKIAYAFNKGPLKKEIMDHEKKIVQSEKIEQQAKELLSTIKAEVLDESTFEHLSSKMDKVLEAMCSSAKEELLNEYPALNVLSSEELQKFDYLFARSVVSGAVIGQNFKEQFSNSKPTIIPNCKAYEGITYGLLGSSRKDFEQITYVNTDHLLYFIDRGIYSGYKAA